MLRRRLLVALTLAGVIAAAVLGLLLRPHAQVAAAAGSPGGSIGLPRRHVLLFVGASYTAALGASSPAHGYAHEVADRLGWPAHIYAVPGAGYINAGPHGHDTFSQQIARLPAGLDPGLMVIQGGRNDGGFPAQRLRGAVCATVAQLRAKYRGAQLVLLGNVPFNQRISPSQRTVEHTMTVAARDCHVPFVDPIAEHWITAANAPELAGSVPGHPNDAGYRYIADRLVADLNTMSRHRIGGHAT